VAEIGAQKIHRNKIQKIPVQIFVLLVTPHDNSYSHIYKITYKYIQLTFTHCKPICIIYQMMGF